MHPYDICVIFKQVCIVSIYPVIYTWNVIVYTSASTPPGTGWQLPLPGYKIRCLTRKKTHVGTRAVFFAATTLWNPCAVCVKKDGSKVSFRRILFSAWGCSFVKRSGIVGRVSTSRILRNFVPSTLFLFVQLYG